MSTLEEVALDPGSVRGWPLIGDPSGDYQILKEFFARLISHYVKTGRAKQINTWCDRAYILHGVLTHLNGSFMDLPTLKFS